MKNLMKKSLILSLSVCALLSVSAFGDAETEAEDLLAEFQGTFVNLFPAFRESAYDAVWEEALSDYCEIPAEDAASVKDTFLSIYEADYYGQEAVKKAEEEPGYFAFDCEMTQGVCEMTFEGDTISGIDADGNEVFNHTYAFLDALKKNFDPYTEMYMAGVDEADWPLLTIYVSDGPDDEFKYFAFGEDSPGETYHMEFRYGNDPEELCKYFTGDYAYWMASTIYKDCDLDTMTNCIRLFVSENADTIKGIAGIA